MRRPPIYRAYSTEPKFKRSTIVDGIGRNFVSTCFPSYVRERMRLFGIQTVRQTAKQTGRSVENVETMLVNNVQCR